MSMPGQRATTRSVEAGLVVIALTMLGLPANGLAQLNATATGAAGIGVTDNDATGTTGSAAGKTSGLWLVNGSFTGSWTGQKQMHALNYFFGLTRTLSQTGRNIQTHGLSWNGTYSPTGKLSFSGMTSATYSSLDAISLVPTANPVNVTGAPTDVPSAPIVGPQAATPIPSSATFFTASANAGVAYHPTPLLAWTAMTSAHLARPVSGIQARSVYGVDESVGHTRALGLNSLVTSAQVGYLMAAETTDSVGNIVYPESRTIHGRILAGWGRELTPFLSVSAALGGLGATNVDGGPIVIGPSWRLSASYLREFGSISAEVDRAPVPSLYLGRLSVSDRATLQLGLPIDRAGRWHANASGAFNHARFMDASNHLVPGTDVLNLQTGLTFQPLLWPVSFSLHYTRLQQIGHSINGAPALPSLERQVVILTVNGTWSRYPAGGQGGSGQGGGEAQ